MFQRALVPLDGSTEGEDILPEALRVSTPSAELFLLHVTPLGGPPDKAFAYLEQARARLRRPNARLVVRQGDPAEEIEQAALELGADLVAMTTHGRSGLRRVLMGSVAEEVLRRSERPMLLARPGCPRPGTALRDIMVPIDETTRSARILELVRGMSPQIVRLVHVIVPIVVAVPPVGVAVPAPAEVADPRPKLSELARPLREAGIKVRIHVTSGFAAQEILRMAREGGSDLIAMSTSGRRGLARLFLGSVAEEVLRETDRPILLRHE